MSNAANAVSAETADSEKATVTLQGTVEKIIPGFHPDVPEKAQIAVEGADELYKEIRIENTLTNPDGEEVKLKVGTEVAVTVEAPLDDTQPKPQEGNASENR